MTYTAIMASRRELYSDLLRRSDSPVTVQKREVTKSKIRDPSCGKREGMLWQTMHWKLQEGGKSIYVCAEGQKQGGRK